MPRFLIFLMCCFAFGCAKPAAVPAVGAAADKPANERPVQSEGIGLEGLISEVEPSVVRVNTRTAKGEGIGSGFVVRTNLILTNYHVIDDAKSAEVIFPDGHKAVVKSVLSYDPDLDIAVLKVDGAENRKPLRISSSAPKKGETAVALGAPKGLSFTVTEGIVSAVRSGDELREFVRKAFPGTWIQTSASITNGNSGGPLVSRSGHVIGMNTFLLVDSANLAFALSAEDISQHLKGVSEDAEGVKLPITNANSQAPVAPEISETLDPELDQRVKAAKSQLTRVVEERRAALQQLSESIDAANLSLKQALINADTSREAESESQVRKARQAMLDLLKAPLKFSTLNRHQLETLEIGCLGVAPLTVVQVLDKTSGTLLVMDTNSSRGRFTTLKISGVDLIDIVDGDQVRLSPTLLFMVLGTYTYTTVSGAEKTIFELLCIGNTTRLEDFSDYETIANSSAMLRLSDLNDVERSLAQQNREKRDREMAEEEARRLALAEQTRKQKEAEEKAKRDAEAEHRAAIDAENRKKRAKSHLDLGKKVFASTPSKAKRYFEVVIESDPSSDEAKEAASYLKRIK